MVCDIVYYENAGKLCRISFPAGNGGKADRSMFSRMNNK